MKAVVLLAVSVAVSAQDVQWWQTAQGTQDRITRQSAKITPTHGPLTNWSGVTIAIDASSRFQTILGFGGALTQASATVFKSLRPELQQELMEMYYGEKGIGYSMGRIPINSCDFSPKIYTFDDMAKDDNLTYFDTSLRDDSDLLIPLINAAISVPNSSMTHGKLFGSPWSPPAWMKTNDNMLSGGELMAEHAAAWALYISKWISAYNAQIKIPIWGVTVQNEPEASQPWESCVYNASSERDFVAMHLGPQLQQDHPAVQVMGFDHNKDHLESWADSLLKQGAGSEDFVDGIAFHWYAGNCFENIKRVFEKYPQKFLLPTEATYELTVVAGAVTPDFIRNGNWSRGEGYGQDILGDLNAGSSGWVDWNILLDHNGGPNHVGNDCDAPVLANTTGSQEVYVHPQYWYMGHFSKFISPGSVRIASNVTAAGKAMQADADCQGWPAYGTCTADSLQSVAFEVGQNLLSVIVMNCADSESDFRITFLGSYFGNTIPAHSIQTYLIKKPQH